ncbi:hypothetical protein C7C46_12860 [Streptomyces tateyamensis]|uniref:Uncharacterized protein n=1 Tax=Streptomyces tateyamensis TaxID=565073 RepID=A0A2V4P757_9ACTN|nr:DUF5819 family protein [Streptomyces tateyamensis]PYC80568.1 hypothetical protein C7C46_12860 [Streptomyces tateyamensis]
MSNTEHEYAESGPVQVEKDPLGLPARLTVTTATVMCVAVAVVHVCLVFLHVAPPNTVSQRFGRQVNAWIYPYFEQNWQLFAPNPESVRQQLSARTATASSDGTRQVSEWVDLSAVDDAAVRHSAFPSHTAQNMLRRAWAAYLETHGADDGPSSERARMLQEYLRNIATQRLVSSGHHAFETVQLRVVNTPIAPPGQRSVRGPTTEASAGTRYLPWWPVESYDR